MIKLIRQRCVRILENILDKYKEAPDISSNYIEALIQNRGYFFADINECVDPYGFSYGNGWQYFTAMVRQIGTRTEEQIIESFTKYLNITFHKNAYDGFRLKFEKSEGLKDFTPSCLAFLVPWSPFDLSQIEDRVRNVNASEKLIPTGLHEDHSPLLNPDHVAVNHFSRLSELRKSIQKNGYHYNNQPDDPIKGYVLTRNGDTRYLIFSGQHRVATLAALNFTILPIRFVYKYVISAEDVAEWPLVKSGLWYSKDALLYFNHLFDFDSHTWAEMNNLII